MSVALDADRMGRTLTRIAHEILERNRGVEELALVGIRTRGVPLAKRLAKAIHEINGHEIPTGALDITSKTFVCPVNPKGVTLSQWITILTQNLAWIWPYPFRRHS